MKIVIRAGGMGTRLWPLSRQKAPKQFLPFLGGKSLFEQKVAAVEPLLRSRTDLYVSVGARFAPLVRTLVPWIRADRIIAEPTSRNTGPAIGLESAVIRAQGGGQDPVIASLTVDDVFADQEKFRHALAGAERFLERHPFDVVTLASKTALPDGGLSYLAVGRRIGSVGRQEFRSVIRWVEKPKGAALTRIFHNPRMYAHTGLYLWKTSRILGSFEAFQPAVFRILVAIERSVGTRKFTATLRRLYPTLSSMSIEEAIARHLDRVVVAAEDFGWSDTGKWHLVQAIGAKDEGGNVRRGLTLTHDTRDSLVWGTGKRLIATLGLRDMIIVDTGDATLICPKERSAEVKDLVTLLKEHRLDRFL